MNFKKYTKHVLFFSGLLGMGVLFSRCTAATTPAAAVATTYSISGTISTGVAAASLSSMKVGGAHSAAFVAPDVNAMATQCSDGYYYNVYCVSYSEPPTAATGAVVCSGGTGSFTVSGLPLSAEIGCFVRRSSNDTTYTTLGTIEIPTTSLSGGTTSIVSQGDLQLAIDLKTDGSITTTVTSGSSNVTSPVTAGTGLDTTQYTGFWKINCDATATSDLVNPVKCKCSNGGQSLPAYQGGGSKNPNPPIDTEQACINDNAAAVTVTDTEQFIEINMYKATPASPLLIGTGVTIPAGTAVPVISVWSASSATVSARGTGGEGAATSVKDKMGSAVSLDWSSVRATNPISWDVTGTKTLGNGVSVDLTTANGAAPMPTGATTALIWKNWIKALYSNSTGFTCTWGTPSVNDAGCLSEFTERVIHENRNVNLPSVRIERNCTSTGCDASVANARVFVDGYKSDYSAIAWGSSTDSVGLTSDGVSAEVRNRYVFEPFEATSTGGGFTQHNFRNNGYKCATSSSTGVLVSPYCTGTGGNYVNCGIREEIAIRFKPSSFTLMTIFFENRSSVAFASLDKWSSGVKTSGSFTEAMTICSAAMVAYEARFQMTAAKQ